MTNQYKKLIVVEQKVIRNRFEIFQKVTDKRFAKTISEKISPEIIAQTQESKAPKNIKAFLNEILTSSLTPHQLQIHITKSIHKYNKLSSNNINKLTKYINYVRREMSSNIAKAMDIKLFGEKTDALDTVLIKDYRGIDIPSHRNPDMDTAISNLLCVFMGIGSKAKENQLLLPVVEGEFREDTRRIIDHFIGKNSTNNLFTEEYNATLTVWNAMKDRDQSHVIRMNNTINDATLAVRYSNLPYLFITKEDNILVGQIHKNELARLKAHLVKELIGEIKNTNAVNIITSGKNPLPYIADTKYLRLLTSADIKEILTQTRENISIRNLIINKITDRVRIEDLINISGSEADNIQTIDPEYLVADVMEIISQDKNKAFPVASLNEQTGEKILRGYINFNELDKPKNAILNVDHDAKPTGIHPETPIATIDHHDPEKTRRAGSNVSNIIIEHLNEYDEAIPLNILQLSIAAICDDTDELSATKVTSNDLRAIRKIMLVMIGRDYDDLDNIKALKYVEGIFKGNMNEQITNLKKCPLIKETLETMDKISQQYQIDLRIDNNPRIYKFDSKNWKTKNISKIDAEGRATPESGRIHVSQEKLTLSTLEKTNGIDITNDLELAQYFFSMVKGSPEQCDAMIHMVSMKPEDITNNYTPEIHGEINDFAYIYSPSIKNMSSIIRQLMIDNTFKKNDGSPYSEEEVNIHVLYSNPLEDGKDLVYTDIVDEVNYIKSHSYWQEIYEETEINTKDGSKTVLMLKSKGINLEKFTTFLKDIEKDGRVGLEEHIIKCFTGKAYISLPAGTFSSRKKQVAPVFPKNK